MQPAVTLGPETSTGVWCYGKVLWTYENKISLHQNNGLIKEKRKESSWCPITFEPLISTTMYRKKCNTSKTLLFDFKFTLVMWKFKKIAKLPKIKAYVQEYNSNFYNTVYKKKIHPAYCHIVYVVILHVFQASSASHRQWPINLPVSCLLTDSCFSAYNSMLFWTWAFKSASLVSHVLLESLWLLILTNGKAWKELSKSLR